MSDFQDLVVSKRQCIDPSSGSAPAKTTAEEVQTKVVKEEPKDDASGALPSVPNFSDSAPIESKREFTDGG